MIQNEGILELIAAKRREKGISLEQIAAATKIGVRSLQAIESGEFSKLPGGIYSTSYIRQYARAIEFDEFELLAFYQNRAAVKPEAKKKDGNPVAPKSPPLFEV